MSLREDRNQLLGPLESAPRNRTPRTLIGIGVAVAVLLLLGVFLLDLWSGATKSTPKKLVDLDSIAVPSNPTDEEIAGATKGVARDSLAALKEGGWIQVAGEDGSLAQEYSARRIDPLPEQWIDMDQPHALMYPKSGRIISLTAEKGKAHVPSRAIESGTFSGNVEIRIYEPLSGGSRANIVETAPSVVVHADVADFDNVQGEITSDDRVEVRTEEITFVGEGLSIQLGEDGAQIERLIIDRAIEPIKIRRRSDLAQGQQPTPPKKEARGNSVAAAQAQAPVSETNDAQGSSATPQKAVASTPAEPAESEGPTWYRMVLHDDIRIVRVGSENGGDSTVHGDQLVATFALGEGGIEAPLARNNEGSEEDLSVPNSALATAMGPAAFIASTATTNFSPQATQNGEEGLVLVYFSGRLVMTPDPDAHKRMLSRDDAEIIVKGLDGRGITVRDEANDADVTCALLRYGAKKDTVELVGTQEHPLNLVSPRMRLAGGTFWLQRSSSTGGLIGPGTMVLAQGTTSLEVALKGLPFAIEHALADAGGVGDSRALMVAAVRAPFQDSTEEAKGDNSPNLEITWQEGIDLDFDDLEDEGRLKQARFRGEVNVMSPDFNLTSETLAVDFSDDPVHDDSVERIVAGGGARVLRHGEAGSLTAETIDLSLEETNDGQTVPTVMIATGGVEAIDPSQQLWADHLTVHFQPAPETSEDAPVQPQRGFAGGLTDGESGSVQITTVHARDSVQVRLKDGARVFAEQLDGDAVNRNLNLVGENIMLLRDNVIADQMREVKLDDERKTVRGVGPGRFRYYEQPIVPETTDRIDRPTPPEVPSLAATWSESLAFTEDVNDGGGRLDLAGKVRVRSEADPKETGRLDADRLRLDLAKRESDGEPASSETEEEVSARDLQKITANGEAVMESRTWETKARSGDPQLFRITGEHVEYEPKTREALVKGAGALLVHDPRESTAENAQDAASKPVNIFGVDGTSRFRWKQAMTMRREVDDRYLIIMEKDVEVLHAGLKDEDTFSLTGDRLEITVDRPRESATAKGDQESSDKEAKPLKGIDLGGPAEMLRVRGIGHVFVRTPEQDVDCEEFDYNVETQIAMLRARSGRVVTIQPKNSAKPIRAELVQWDLRTGRMRILSGEGGITR